MWDTSPKENKQFALYFSNLATKTLRSESSKKAKLKTTNKETAFVR